MYSVSHNLVRARRQGRGTFDRNEVLSTITVGIFSYFPNMKPQNNISQHPEFREVEPQTKFSLTQNSRNLVTGVALSMVMTLGACTQAKASENETNNNKATTNRVVEPVPTKIHPDLANYDRNSAEQIEQSQRFEYIPSKLGIDYRAIAPSPLAEMLSQGEGEWMKNALADYEEDTIEVWKDEFVPQLVKGLSSKSMDKDMADFTPKMLLLFSSMPLEQEKYRGLTSTGLAYFAQKFGKLLAGTET